ncbi:MAG: hypothetical protein KC708_23405, partial [Anaerolineae bacterium]|nr:hypothetical protein [Anaerolineae bacterium]
HKLLFKVPIPTSTATNRFHPDKHKLRSQILALRERGFSYREIARLTGIHFTRVAQLVKHDS